MSPPPSIDRPLIEAEHAGDPVGDARTDGEQVAGEVAAVADAPVGRRVEPVVVAGRQVDDAVEEPVVRGGDESLVVGRVLVTVGGLRYLGRGKGGSSAILNGECFLLLATNVGR